MGQCVFLNDVSSDEMLVALRKHKEIMKSYPREGAGLEAFVDASDTGYTVNAKHVEGKVTKNKASKSVINDDAADGTQVDGKIASKTQAQKYASGPEGVNGLSTPAVNGTNGHANGIATAGGQ